MSLIRKFSLLLIILLIKENSSKTDEEIFKETFSRDLVILNPPEREGGMPLYEALSKRKSERDFDPNGYISVNQLSQSLWACVGVNRPDFKRTTASATAWYPYDVYVFVETGIYRFDPLVHDLIRIVKGDYRYLTGTQDFVKDATVNYMLIADLDKPGIIIGTNERKKYAYLDTGHCTQSMGIYAASVGLKCVPRAMFNADPVLDLLKLDKERYLITLAYSLGK